MRPTRSRLMRRIEKTSRRNLVFSLLGIVILVFAVFKIGIPLLAQFSLFLGNLGNSAPETETEKTIFIQAPRLEPLPIATNSGSIKITGISLPEKEVETHINEELIGKATADKNGKFEIKSLKLQEGENNIKARVKDKEKFSEFSENVLVIFDNKPPILELTNPAPNQDFSKEQNKIEVKGKTEIESKVTVNGSRAIVDTNGNFSYTLALVDGENKIQVKAVDLAGNEVTIERTVTYSP